MKIEDVKKLESRLVEGAVETTWEGIARIGKIAHEAIAALRAEAWHPIEKAEELGVLQDGKEWRIQCEDGSLFLAIWNGDTGWLINGIGHRKDVTHVAVNNPPEEA